MVVFGSVSELFKANGWAKGNTMSPLLNFVEAVENKVSLHTSLFGHLTTKIEL